MSTPTPSGAASKRSAGSGGGSGSGGVSTPSHLSHTSPAPRSVPSPAAARHHTAGKTPTSSGGAGKTVGTGPGTPMMRNPSQQTASNPSPSAAQYLASLNTPHDSTHNSGNAANFTGGSGSTTLHNLPSTPSLPHSAGAGSVPMGPSMSDLGLSLSLSNSLSGSGGLGGAGQSSAARAANEESLRRARLRKVLASLARPAGRVSEEGIARVARRVGFAHDLDDGTTGADLEGKAGNRTITVAGNAVMVEIDLQQNVPRSVNVVVNGGGEGMRAEEKKAGEVLFKGLKVEGKSGSAVVGDGLTRFARDLDALAKIDRLSSQRLNCFEALSGIYGCLKRLWEVEVKAAQDEMKSDGADENGERAQRLVACRKSGRPLAHAKGRVGWELVYWESGPQFARGKRKSSSQEDEEMQIDSIENRNDDQSGLDEDGDTDFSLKLGVEASPAGMYPSLRVSDSWLPETIDLPPPDSADTLAWQDPPPTFLTPDENTDAMAIDGNQDPQQKLPDARFVAHLDPPLVMPFTIAAQILGSLGLPAPNMLTLPPQYAASVIDPAAPAHAQTGTFSRTTRQTVLSLSNDRESLETHIYTLDTAKPDWSYTLRDLPFSHPRQIINLLPTLRQWAQVGSLLKQAFVEVASSPQPVNGASSREISLKTLTSLTVSGSPGQDVNMLDDSPENSLEGHTPFPINVLLNVTNAPTLNFSFPIAPSSTVPSSSNASASSKHHKQQRLASVTLQVLINAELAIIAYDGIDLPPLQKKADSSEKASQDNAASDEQKSDRETNDDGKQSQAENGTVATDAQEREKSRLERQHDVQRRLARALAACGDCRVWVEWMRSLRSGHGQSHQ